MILETLTFDSCVLVTRADYPDADNSNQESDCKWEWSHLMRVRGSHPVSRSRSGPQSWHCSWYIRTSCTQQVQILAWFHNWHVREKSCDMTFTYFISFLESVRDHKPLCQAVKRWLEEPSYLLRQLILKIIFCVLSCGTRLCLGSCGDRLRDYVGGKC